MKKLNKKKVKWIIKEVDKGEKGAWTIGQIQNITPRWVREIHRKYKDGSGPEFKKCGRKPRVITDEERKIVIDAYKEILTGATMIEQYLDEKGIHINHNRIHRILLEEGLAKQESKKKKKRKWVRYERKHSLSLVHADWFEHKRKKCILFIDDASRFMPCCRGYGNATADTTIHAFKQCLKWGKPKQVHTDHGAQFVANEQEGKKQGTSQFTEYLHSLGIQHLKARIKHPQANGKAERAIGTIKRLWDKTGSLDKAVQHYNYKRPHRSLTNGKLRTPYQAFMEKSRK
jgi:putative transposase